MITRVATRDETALLRTSVVDLILDRMTRANVVIPL